MAAAIYERVRWLPSTPEEEMMVRRALADVVASPHFCNSKRYPAFLEYVVHAVLSGKGDDLKERTLGMEVFGRRPDYDTNADTVVRYTAGEVRKRLSLYYSDTGASAPVRIQLPVGSYVPEIVLVPHATHAGKLDSSPTDSAAQNALSEALLLGADTTFEADSGSHPEPITTSFHAVQTAEPSFTAPPAAAVSRHPVAWAVAAAVAVLAFVTANYVRHSLASRPGDAVLIQFWTPTLNASGSKLICTGASIFDPNHLSGVDSATKDTDYPFLSVQIAESIAHLSGFLERHGAAYALRTSANTPLTDLRERPVILLGAYNNNWTIRLLEPLRFHFAPEPAPAAIVDSQQPSRQWTRDASQSYANSDDYAIVARFTDATTHGPVVVLAGLGRNGTEAATQFVTAPQFILDYTSQHPLPSNTNVEFVLRSRVIDGRTGAPSIVAAYTW